MGRLPRIQVEGYPYHVVTRCNNKENSFNKEGYFHKLMEIIAKFKDKHQFKLYAYTVMSNHCHYLIEAGGGATISVVMRDIMANFAKWYNWRHKRKGHFWESRYHSSIIEDDEYGLVCMRYIHRNPVRAGIVKRAFDYPWSSVRHNAFGEIDELIDNFPSFLGLSPYPKVRMRQYERWIEEPFETEKYRRRLYEPFIGGDRFIEKMQKKYLSNQDYDLFKSEI